MQKGAVMIHRYIAHIFIFSALCLTPYNHAAEKQPDPLDKMLQEKFRPYQDQETNPQKSWRLAKEYGPFVASIALGGYAAYTSKPLLELKNIPGYIFTAINAYALYKSHAMTKQWLKQLPTERTFPFQLLIPSTISLATFCFSNTSFFKPSYITTASSFTVFLTGVWRFVDANKQHTKEKNIIHNEKIITEATISNDLDYANKFAKEAPPKKDNLDNEIYWNILSTYRRQNQNLAEQHKRNIVTIMQRPWGSQFIAGLSKNSKYAIFKSVGWQIDYPNEHELVMGIDGYPEQDAIASLITK